MKRIDKIHQELVKQWENATKQEILTKVGTTTRELAELTGISRANASSELNKLVRQAKVLKVRTFPVRYLPVKAVKEALSIDSLDCLEVDSVEQFIQPKENININRQSMDPLKNMIGYKGSLHQAVSQAKAALLYPPHGLHMMLLGPTGVGKTYFADNIFRFAKYHQILKKDAPFITFNCADYYHNPQLLLSILFGHAKGAYTGAEEVGIGLVEQADGGILLLDEVHRLPPEGQEMLFYFIDRGNFNRLGENQKKRHSDVLIICATTEEVDSALLSTFMRRIPMTITIPALDERPVSERIELMKYLFQMETKRIHKNLSVERQVFKIILSQENIGNVGQIKSQIQLTCAQAFLNNVGLQGEIRIGVKDLPEQEKNRWLKTAAAEREKLDLSNYLNRVTFFNVDSPLVDPQEEDNIYQLIEDKVERLRKEGISDQEVQQYIMTDLHLHIKNFFRQMIKEENFSKLVAPQTIELVSRLKKIAEKELATRFDQSFIHYFGLHLEAFFKRGSKSDYLLKDEIETIKQQNTVEYRIAKLFQQEIVAEMSTLLPDIEVIYLTMLLSSVETLTLTSDKKIGILVVSHGDSTATSMVRMGSALLGKSNIAALDMPLHVAPEEIYARMVAKVRQLDQKRGVLLLYDMGSFGILAARLQTETGVKIAALPNVTSSLVLEAMRKANYLEMDLSTLCFQLRQDLIDSLKMSVIDEHEASAKEQVILSICMSGSGTARKIQQMIEKIIRETTQRPIRVLTMSALQMDQLFPQLMEKYEVLVAVGSSRPNADLPFISLEELLSGEGEQFLKILVGEGPLSAVQVNHKKDVVVSQMCQEMLEQHLLYLNPLRLNQMLQEWIRELEDVYDFQMSNSQKVRCVVHTAFALERASKHEELAYDETPSKKIAAILPKVQETLKKATAELNIQPSYDELCYISETVLDHQ